jgi:hypothetical protein
VWEGLRGQKFCFFASMLLKTVVHRLEAWVPSGNLLEMQMHWSHPDAGFSLRFENQCLTLHSRECEVHLLRCNLGFSPSSLLFHILIPIPSVQNKSWLWYFLSLICISISLIMKMDVVLWVLHLFFFHEE